MQIDLTSFTTLTVTHPSAGEMFHLKLSYLHDGNIHLNYDLKSGIQGATGEVTSELDFNYLQDKTYKIKSKVIRKVYYFIARKMFQMHVTCLRVVFSE